MSQYGFAIHTASSGLGLAINNFAGDARSQVWALGRGTSNQLHQCLLDFLPPQAWDDVAWLAVAKGPGGFTGTRIGVVTARTLAQQLGRPLFAISTLAGVAWQAAKAIAEPLDLAVQMRAQRGEVFVAIYRVEWSPSGLPQQLRPQLVDSVMQPDVWLDRLKTWPSPYRLVEADQQIATSVADLLELAHLAWRQGDRPHWSEALPFYGQHPVDQ